MMVPQRLTPEQQAVVEATERTCLTIAPAGSGKTAVLVQRIEHLLNKSPGESFRLLAVTFTVKAADELKARVSQSIGEEAWRVDANTIHGFALDWLQRSGQLVGVGPDVVVYAHDGDRMDLLRRFLSSVQEPDPDERTLRNILRAIDNLRTNLVKPSEAPHDTVGTLSFRLPELYETYLTALDSVGGIDFPGMLVKLLDLFEADPGTLGRLRRTYRQILVDEGQDLTQAQAELLRTIVGDDLELFVVADDRQSINGWAGGGMQWAKQLAGPNCRRFELRHNFRCATQVLSLASQVAKHFEPPRPDAVTPPGAPDGIVITHEAKDSVDEARTVVGWIEELISRGVDPNRLVDGEEPRVAPEDIAVIARTRYGLDAVQEELNRREHTISVQVDTGSLLTSSEARLLYALLEVKANENNIPAWKRVDEELFNILGERLRITGGRSSFTDLLGTVSGSPSQWLVELVRDSTSDAEGLEGMIEALESKAYLAEPDLGRLIGWWREYRASTTLQDRTIGGFLRYLLRVQQARPDQPGIRLLTTHRAKGLEFRAVAIVGLNQGTFPDYRELNDSEKLQGERRAFYVSVTRASRALLLTWPRMRRTRYNERRADPSQFLKEAGVLK